MPVADKAAAADNRRELQVVPDDQSPIANDNAAEIFKSISKPLSWQEATAFVASSSAMAVVLTFCLLLAVVG